MRNVDRRDATVGVGFVLAAMVEAVVRDRTTPGLLVFDVSGALWLAVLAVRRQRPVLTILVIAAAGIVGTTVTQVVWPETSHGGGVWILALMLAAYSLAAYGHGWSVILGVLAPLAVVTVADLTTMSGWSRVSGMLFVTVFIGLVPTVVGRLVRIRRTRLQSLRDQHERIVEALQVRQDSAVLTERLSAMERLQHNLAGGLRGLATTAESPSRAGEVEDAARLLLSRTREEVVALTAPYEAAPSPDVDPTDHVAVLRAASQPWGVLAAGAVAASLYVETTRVLAPSTSGWLALGSAIAVGAPLALTWWRPFVAVTLAWVAAAVYSRQLTSLDGSLSDVGLVFVTAFAVAALSRRRTAVAGLLVCGTGQLVGVGTDDPFGAAVILLLCWMGGLAVNEASRLVEETRANNELLAQQEEAYAQRGIVEERLRLAREVHDAIGHSLTVVVLQAGAARRLTDADPEKAAEVMRTVAAVAREGAAALVPVQGRADLAGLLDNIRATGLDVEADLADEALLDPGQRLVVVRVVQEALTNILRHAPGARARVAVRRNGRQVEIVVVNSAPMREGTGPGTGRGLAGIRERVAAAGGRVTWGEGEDSGFEVRALLPAAALAEATQ